MEPLLQHRRGQRFFCHRNFLNAMRVQSVLLSAAFTTLCDTHSYTNALPVTVVSEQCTVHMCRLSIR
eukprot:6484556-Amphidinium_carterae.1